MTKTAVFLAIHNSQQIGKISALEVYKVQSLEKGQQNLVLT